VIRSQLCATLESATPWIGNHLWQSTLFAIAAGLLTTILRNNHARRRWKPSRRVARFTLPWTPEARKGPADGRQAKFNNYGEFFNTLQKNNLNAGARGQVPVSSRPRIFTAIQDQLGLKSESQTRPVEILVIDAAEKASEN
jgi:uncharacterized protein DUF3738